MKETLSPCNQECIVDDQDVCTGCGRTMIEIAEWPRACEERRQQICAAAAARLPDHPRPPDVAEWFGF